MYALALTSKRHTSTYFKSFVDCKLGVFRVFIQLEKILPLLGEAAGEKLWEESLNGSEHQYVSNRSQRDDENNHERDEG